MHYISTTDQGPGTNDNSEKKTSPTHKVFHQEEEKVQNKELGEDGHLNTNINRLESLYNNINQNHNFHIVVFLIEFKRIQKRIVNCSFLQRNMYIIQAKI